MIMKNWNRRSDAFINFLYRAAWPVIKKVLCIHIAGTEYLTQANQPLLFISNHNSGALIESFSALMILKDHHPRKVFGFTHPSIFKIPIISHYFLAVGAVPATYEVAKEILSEQHSLLIFPGGNSQALRSIWKYKENHFRYSQGWAKIAIENKVPVVPVTFRNTHFINPILLSGSWISKILILPALLKIKVTSISLAQILMASLVYWLCTSLNIYSLLTFILTYLVFILSPLTPILPAKVFITFHAPIETLKISRDKLEKEVNEIMDRIYD